MGIVVVPTYGSDPANITAANLDAKVAGLATEFNGEIDNDNIASDAAIANSKLNLATITQNITHSGTMTHSGTVTLSAATTMSGKDFTEAKGADVASAATCTIWVTDGNFIHITGTTTITSFGTAAQAGDERTIVFDGALTLTHNSTSLILPTGANITTAAGDTAIVRAETTANARVIAYLRKDGTAITAFTPTASNALSGSVIQMVEGSTSTVSAITADVSDITAEFTTSVSTEITTKAVTPNNSSNLLRIDYEVTGTTSAASIGVALGLFQDAGTNSLQTVAAIPRDGNVPFTLSGTHWMTAGTTSATTFKLRAGCTAGDGTFYVNGNTSSTALFNGKTKARIVITEIKA